MNILTQHLRLVASM